VIIVENPYTPVLEEPKQIEIKMDVILSLSSRTESEEE
jgi:hypothetical protein